MNKKPLTALIKRFTETDLCTVSDTTDVGPWQEIMLDRCKTLPDFTAAKGSYAMAIVCKVMTPSKQQHTTDLYIESMEPIPSDRVAQAIAMVKQLQRVSTVNHGNAATSTEAAWQQRKCRRMQRYPTQT